MTNASRQPSRMARPERVRLLSRLIDEFERRGWREDGHTALALVQLVDAGGGVDVTSDVVAQVVSRRFLAQNEASAPEVRDALLAATRR